MGLICIMACSRHLPRAVWRPLGDSTMHHSTVRVSHLAALEVLLVRPSLLSKKGEDLCVPAPSAWPGHVLQGSLLHVRDVPSLHVDAVPPYDEAVHNSCGPARYYSILTSTLAMLVVNRYAITC